MTTMDNYHAQEHFKPLSHADLAALASCVRRAAEWRGMFTGHQDPDVLDNFDAEIKRAKRALRKVRELKKQGL